MEKIFHSFAALTREIFFPLEDKLHMFTPPCNILCIIWAKMQLFYKNWDKLICLYHFIHLVQHAKNVAEHKTAFTAVNLVSGEYRVSFICKKAK